MGCLSRLVLQITMNKHEPWTLEPWHVSTSFRKAGFVVPEHAIKMPTQQIKGPDLSLQDKEFYVTVKVCCHVLFINFTWFYIIVKFWKFICYLFNNFKVEIQ